MPAWNPFLEDRPARRAIGERLHRWRRLVRRQVLGIQREAHYQALIDGLHEGVLFVDEAGHVVTCNPAAERILDLTHTDLQGRPTVDPMAFHAVHEDGRPFTDEEHPSRQVLATRQPCLGVIQGLMRHGAIHRWIIINALPLMEWNGSWGVAVSIVDITQAKLMEDRLRHEAIRDQLTGLYNRRYLMDQLARAQNAARRHGHGLCLCMCDLDHFKGINDTFGHVAGDLAICAFGQLLASHIRQEDLVARFGGDEFCILFTHSRAPQAAVVLERIREEVESLRLPLSSHQHCSMTASFGVAEFLGEEESPSRLFETADAALYQAKAEGRNRVVSA